MTDEEGTENTEHNAESETDDAASGLNQEDAQERASADYQQRLEEFDNVDSTPVVTVPETGTSGTIEMPKS
jgi:hypothetical protein